MARRRRPPTLQEAARADVEQGEAHWDRRDALLSWDTRLAHKAKRWTRLVAAGTGLVVAVGTAVGTAKGYAVKLWHVIRVRPQPPADPPVHTDVASTALDRVEKPPKP